MKWRILIAAAVLAGLAVGQEEWASLRRRRAIIINLDNGPPPATGPLSEGTWTEIPNSRMDSLYNAAIDGDAANFRSIQEAWGGGTCINNELYVFGGGHGDSYNNGVFKMNPTTGAWTRVFSPTPRWTAGQCPGGICPAVGGDCAIANCGAMPDGSATSRHTYMAITGDSNNMYMVGGAVYSSGFAGNPAIGWKFNVSSAAWTPTAVSTIATGNSGPLIYENGKLYYTTSAGGGFRIYDIASDTWTDPPGNATGYTGFTGGVFAEGKFFYMGNNSTLTPIAHYVPLASFGASPTAIPGAPTSVSLQGYPGMTYYSPETKILLWHGGASLTALDPVSLEWSTITPAGDPGQSNTRGFALGRLSYCGGRVILVNGTDHNAWYIDVPDEEPPVFDLPDPLLGRPYYGHLTASPALSDAIVEDQCGPIDEWPTVINVTSDAEMTALAGTILNNYTQRVVVRVHWKSTPYTATLDARDAKCIKVEGVPGPGGEKPLIPKIQKSRSFGGGPVRAGGIIVDGMSISPGLTGLTTGGAEGVAQDNSQVFVIIRNTEIRQTSAHSVLFSPTLLHMYVEIGDSYFQMADAHDVYIDHIAMAYVHDSIMESPGNGVALRCIAARCVVENVTACSLQCDGTVLPPGSNPLQPGRNYQSDESPFEIYTCGEHTVNNTHVIYKRISAQIGSLYAATFRHREQMRGCDLGEPDMDTLQWTGGMDPKFDPEFYDPARWATVTPLRSTVNDLTIDCLGLPCAGFHVSHAYPVWANADTDEFNAWRVANGPWANWNDFVAEINTSGNQHWNWLTGQTLLAARNSLMNGNYGDAVPYDVPLPGWYQRAMIDFTNITLNNGNGQILHPTGASQDFCEGVPPVNDTCTEANTGRSFRMAITTLDGVPFP